MVALALALASLVWIGGLTWNWVSNRGDLSRGEVERLRENGAAVVDEPADREWGERMATVADPDGNFLHVGSR